LQNLTFLDDYKTHQHLLGSLELSGHKSHIPQFGRFVAAKETGTQNGQN